MLIDLKTQGKCLGFFYICKKNCVNTKILLKSIFILFIATSTFSQETQLSTILIPLELKEDANAVIRHNVIEVTLKSVSSMTVRVRKVVTVLNKLGRADASMSVHYNNDTKVTSLFAKVYDSFGNQIKKYSKNKFLDVSAVDGGTLYSDARMKYLDYTPTTYPYTIVFESEYETSSTGFVPGWFPTNGYYSSVEKSEYIIKYPLNKKVRVREKSFENFPIKNLSKDGKIHYVLEKLPAIEYESHGISMRDFMPNLKVAFNNFSLKGVKGYASNWKELGMWEFEMLYSEGDILSESTKSIIKNLTKGIKTKKEKVKAIYNFVQNKTRYINVSIGIGGFKPVSSNKVDLVGYGDCKGLTNYTRALLNVIGIESFFAEVFAGKNKRNMDYKFTRIQGNHVILYVPNGEKDIWLECTSQTMPFGFLGSFTDDREVMVITPEGGLIKRTPKYVNTYNLQTIKANAELKANGGVETTLVRKSYGIQYDDKYSIEDKSKQDLIKYYKSSVWGYNNNLEVQNIKLINNKEKVEFIENLDLSIADYATVKDSSYLFRVNVFNKYSNIPKRYRKREKPLKISRGFYDKDEFVIQLPKGYKTTFLPQPKEIENKFGRYKVQINKINDTSIKYSREFLLKEGIFPKEDYKKYRKFIKKIVKYDNLRLELTKQTIN